LGEKNSANLTFAYFSDGLVEPPTRKDERHSHENTGCLIFSPSSALDPPPKKKDVGSKFPQNMRPKDGGNVGFDGLNVATKAATKYNKTTGSSNKKDLELLP